MIKDGKLPYNPKNLFFGESPYRIPASRPSIPTEKKKKVPMTKENKTILAVALLFSFMISGLMSVGWLWNYMTASVAFTSVLSLIFASIGLLIILSVKLEW